MKQKITNDKMKKALEDAIVLSIMKRRPTVSTSTLITMRKNTIKSFCNSQLTPGEQILWDALKIACE